MHSSKTQYALASPFSHRNLVHSMAACHTVQCHAAFWCERTFRYIQTGCCAVWIRVSTYDNCFSMAPRTFKAHNLPYPCIVTPALLSLISPIVTLIARILPFDLSMASFTDHAFRQLNKHAEKGIIKISFHCYSSSNNKQPKYYQSLVLCCKVYSYLIEHRHHQDSK